VRLCPTRCYNSAMIRYSSLQDSAFVQNEKKQQEFTLFCTVWWEEASNIHSDGNQVGPVKLICILIGCIVQVFAWNADR
jgi:hypothetical protein